MPRYEKLDSWNACHALVLAVLRETDGIEREPLTVERLRYLALRAAGKIAFGSGTGSRTMLRRSAELSAGWLTELAYDLDLAEVMGVISRESCERLNALCGRAQFYVMKLVLPPELPPDAGPLPPGEEPGH